MPLRVMPHVGRAVVVIYLDSRVGGVVSAVLEDGRRIIVTTDEGERIGFALNRATAAFAAEQVRSGPRLSFEPE